MKRIVLAAAAIVALSVASGFLTTGFGAEWSSAHHHHIRVRHHHRSIADPAQSNWLNWQADGGQLPPAEAHIVPYVPYANAPYANVGHDPGRDWCGGDFC